MPEDQVIGYVVWYWKHIDASATFIGWVAGFPGSTKYYKIPLNAWEYGEQVSAIARLMGYEQVTKDDPQKYSRKFEIPREWADAYGPTN